MFIFDLFSNKPTVQWTVCYSYRHDICVENDAVYFGSLDFYNEKRK